MRILLVEPGYRNKYPPIGLMKISSYHKSKGDHVCFVKGFNTTIEKQLWDRIYITTLFTFDYALVIKTIRHYKKNVANIEDIYVGGILASLMTNDLINDTGIKNIVSGQLTNSSLIGFSDNVNIDGLPVDYDILNEIAYEYPTSNNYIAYTTRGCPNKCLFCAVPLLEPEFKNCNNLIELISSVNSNFGHKRNLLLLDNNVLYSPELKEIVQSIKEAGFTKDSSFVNPNLFEIYVKKLAINPNDKKIEDHLISLFASIKPKIKEIDLPNYLQIEKDLRNSENKAIQILDDREKINWIFEKYKDRRPKKRYVDFNQGIDARLLNEEKVSLLSELPIRPLRIAFDSIAEKKVYEKAVRSAAKHGLNDISNYMLYNFLDKPEDLWERLYFNVNLREELGVAIFSFPMKYIPINNKNRDYVGKHWNIKYLRAITAILLVTKGIVAHGRSFFEKAFGKTKEEYFEILAMPRDFIIYRSKFENLGLTDEWRYYYQNLNLTEKTLLFDILSGNRGYVSNTNDNLSKIMKFYFLKNNLLRISRSQIPISAEIKKFVYQE
jgi:hypothetical protein